MVCPFAWTKPPETKMRTRKNWIRVKRGVVVLSFYFLYSGDGPLLPVCEAGGGTWRTRWVKLR